MVVKTPYTYAERKLLIHFLAYKQISPHVMVLVEETELVYIRCIPNANIITNADIIGGKDLNI
jgi:hypothetical protein